MWGNMSHYYPINGKKLASVTTIVDDCTNKALPLSIWSANQTQEWIKQNCIQASNKPIYLASEDDLNQARFKFREVSQEALDVGSEVHNAIEIWLAHGKEPIKPRPEVLAGFLAFLEWADANKLKTIATELTVHDDRSAGTLDWVGYLNDHVTVTDFKTSKAIYAQEMRIQTAAYRYFWNQDTKNPTAVRNAVLRLDKQTGFYEFRDFSKSYLKDLDVYQKMVDLFYAKHPKIAKGAL